MNEIHARIRVGADHRITGRAPEAVPPPGEHDVTIRVRSRDRGRWTMASFPVDHGPWDDAISLRREDMCGDYGAADPAKPCSTQSSP